MTRFCYMTRTDICYVYDIAALKRLDFGMLTVNSFISFSVFSSQLFISSSVANDSVCVRSTIVWNRWIITLKEA